MSAYVDEFRKKVDAFDKKRDEGLVTPDDVVRFDNIFYGDDSELQCLDVYRPKNADGVASLGQLRKLPVIISVHGGGWIYGWKETYQFYCMNLAQRGFAVVNFSYRLAPEYKFPACLEDTAKVFQWVLDNSETYGFDAEHIFAVGDSAGGHILSMFCNLCSNEEYRSKYQFNVPENFTPKAVALNCGAYCIELGESQYTNDSTKLSMNEFLEHKGTDEELDLINPIPYITKKFPPVMVMTANEDFLKNNAPLIVKRLEEMQVPFTMKVYGDEKTPLGHVFHLDMRSEMGSKCNDEQCAFFKSFLKNQ